MMSTTQSAGTPAPASSTRPGSNPTGYYSRSECRLDDLLAVLDTTTDLVDYPHAEKVEQGVVVYSSSALRDACRDESSTRAVQSEIARALQDGPGIAVFTGAFESDVVDRATAAFERLIEEQRASGVVAGDHFAKPGANDRIWNALEKLAVLAPETFVDYYANDIVALASRSWLGPGYQMTSQVNVVNPGGAGQTVHRDYHLGFLGPDVSEHYPAQVHHMSPGLTLQGAVAHCDMPVESGPTLYLPHSQKYSHGYLAYWDPAFQEYFQSHHVQLPLTKGDAVFFNPALLHAAGSNHTADIRRMANLLQVSSAFGRAMETVDRERVTGAIYPALLDRKAAGMAPSALAAAVAASAEGYAFPTNLDLDQPIDGMSPRTMADVVTDALERQLGPDELTAALAAQAATKRSR